MTPPSPLHGSGEPPYRDSRQTNRRCSRRVYQASTAQCSKGGDGAVVEGKMDEGGGWSDGGRWRGLVEFEKEGAEAR